MQLEGILSAKLGLPSLTIRSVVEPYLIREGFVTKDRSAMRILTERGMNHVRTTAWPLEQWRTADGHAERP